MQLPGKYQRLTFSGSVIRRTFSVRATPTGTIEAPSELYTDLGY